MVRFSRSQEETGKIAADIVKERNTNVICLYGDLGAGKTTFVRAGVKSLGISDTVQSPTFTYQRVYVGKKVTVYHFDLYRLESADDLVIHDITEALHDKKGIVFIEWAEKLAHQLPKNRTDVSLEHVDENTRAIMIKKCITDADVKNLIEEFHVPLHVRRHGVAVSNFAVDIGENLIKQGEQIDIELVRNAGLLHDLVRVVDFHTFEPESFSDPVTASDIDHWKELREKYKGHHHAIVGGQILEDRGFYDVANVVRKHRYMQIENGFDTWEEKLVYYADKRAKHDKIVSLRERLDDGRKRNLPGVPKTKKSYEVENKIFALEKEILKMAKMRLPQSDS